MSALRAPLAGAARAAAPALLAFTLALPASLPAADAGVEASIPARLAAKSLLLDAAARGPLWVAVGERGHVLTSRDRGATWTQASVPTRAMLTGVWMHDEKLGWAVGHDETILRTEDGGTTWKVVHAAPEAERPLLDVWFADAAHGIAIGAYGALLVTADGGATWQERPLSEDDFHLNAIAAAADGTLYVAGEAGHLYRSTDRGASWTHLATPYEGSYFGVLPLGESSLLLFGLRGRLFRSDDRGATWSTIATGLDATLMGGLDLGGGRVAVAGLAGALLLSDDGGHTFRGAPQADRKANVALLADGGDLVLVGEGGARRPEAKP